MYWLTLFNGVLFKHLKNYNMITLCILSNFSGTILQTIKAAFICILLDSTYLIPAIYYNI